MKKIILLALIMVSIFGKIESQNDDRFTFEVRTEPFLDLNTHNEVINHGFNIGAGLTYQMPELMYFKVQCFSVPELNNLSYFDWEGVIGFHYRDRWDEWRVYGGFKFGGTIRSGNHGRWGQELGLEYYFGNAYVGVQLANNRRTDSKEWQGDPFWEQGVAIKFGVVL